MIEHVKIRLPFRIRRVILFSQPLSPKKTIKPAQGTNI
jgi:hypothetical protein